MIGQGYQCAGAYTDEQLVGICGLWVATRFYCGKYIEPDNVVVHPDYRSLGVGQKLMAWVYEYARTLDCEVVELNSYVGILAPTSSTSTKVFKFSASISRSGWRVANDKHKRGTIKP